MNNQPYLCETREEFSEKLALLKSYISESNVDGIIDNYCNTSPVLYDVSSDIVYIVDCNLSFEPTILQEIIRDILQKITSQKGYLPNTVYIYN